jgi:hypothetical protein
LKDNSDAVAASADRGRRAGGHFRKAASTVSATTRDETRRL